MKQLKPCPFCGSRAFTYQKKIQNGWLAEIACWHKYDDSFNGCAIKPSISTVQNTEKEAYEVVKKAWNTRVEISGKEGKTSPVWHTGTPTERDYYWIAYRYHDIGLMEYAKAEYCGGGWIVLSDDYEHEKILAWQKITPYEGEK